MGAPTGTWGRGPGREETHTVPHSAGCDTLLSQKPTHLTQTWHPHPRVTHHGGPSLGQAHPTATLPLGWAKLPPPLPAFHGGCPPPPAAPPVEAPSYEGSGWEGELGRSGPQRAWGRRMRERKGRDGVEGDQGQTAQNGVVVLREDGDGSSSTERRGEDRWGGGFAFKKVVLEAKGLRIQGLASRARTRKMAPDPGIVCVMGWVGGKSLRKVRTGDRGPGWAGGGTDVGPGLASREGAG